MADLWIHTVTIAAREPHELARFWAAMLEYDVVPNHSDSVQIGGESGARLLFAPERTDGYGRDRFHLDLRPIDHDAAVARALALGATRLTTSEHDSWARMADPEGNRFCILQSQDAHRAHIERHGAGTPTITF